jgi:hypothetical protein
VVGDRPGRLLAVVQFTQFINNSGVPHTWNIWETLRRFGQWRHERPVAGARKSACGRRCATADPFLQRHEQRAVQRTVIEKIRRISGVLSKSAAVAQPSSITAPANCRTPSATTSNSTTVIQNPSSGPKPLKKSWGSGRSGRDGQALRLEPERGEPHLRFSRKVRHYRMTSHRRRFRRGRSPSSQKHPAGVAVMHWRCTITQLRRSSSVLSLKYVYKIELTGRTRLAQLLE